MLSRKILISGISGFVGANLARKLLNRQQTIYALIRPDSTNAWRLDGILKDLNIVRIDIQDKEKLTVAVKKIRPDTIFHLAAYGSYPNETSFEKIIGVNLLGTINLVSVCARVGFDIFVNTGSSSEYGIKAKPMNENDSLEPMTTYGWSKAAASLFCQQFSYEHELKIATIRPFSVFGPYEEKGRLIPTLMKAAVTGKTADLASPKSVRDYIYIGDLIDAYLACANKKINGIFNIGSGKEFTTLEIFKKIKKISGGKLTANWNKLKPRNYEIKHWVADIKKAEKVIGWKPNNIDIGLVKTYEWFKENLKYYK